MITLKLISIGDYSLGKTSLINRYTKNLPPVENTTIIGIDLGIKIIQKENQ